MEKKITVPVKMEYEQEIPGYQRDGDACVDLRSAEDLVLKAGTQQLVKTGFHVAIPKGYGGFVFARSGNALKYGISLRNSVGIIDSNYRGDVGVILVNNSEKDFEIKKGDRVAQFMILPVPYIEFVSAETLEESERGELGFGSSGLR